MENISKNVDRFLSLVKNLEGNTKRVAEDYVRYYDLPGHGKEFRRLLISSGMEAWFLDTLHEVGLGNASPMLCFMDREKSRILMRCSVEEQERIVNDGIGRTPFNNIAADKLREFVNKVPPRKKKSPKSKVPRKSIPKWVLRTRGIHFNQADISWDELDDLLVQAHNCGYIS